MVDLVALTIEGVTEFTNENLMQICGNLVGLKHLDVSCTSVDNVGIKYVTNLTNLESLHLRGIGISDNAINDICSCLKKLKEINFSGTKFLTDLGVAKLCSSLVELKKVNLSYCRDPSDESLFSLQRLNFLEELNLELTEKISPLGLLNFFQATKSTLRKFSGSGVSHCIWDAFVNQPRSLEWGAVAPLKDEDVSLLVQILGDELCAKIHEIDLSQTQISETSLALISKKMKSLRKLSVNECSRINFENLKLSEIDNNNSLDESTITFRPFFHLCELNASETQMNDSDVAKFVCTCTNLTFLNLSFSQKISELSLTSIAEKCKMLKKVNLRNRKNLSASGIENFKSVLPNCDVVDK
jgi:hypothetical protein